MRLIGSFCLSKQGLSHTLSHQQMMAMEDDFESLLDAAFGIDSSNQHEHTKAQPLAVQPCSLDQQHQQQHTASCSAQPSPEASPVHLYPSHVQLIGSRMVGSPCLSDASMQMHASPPHNNSPGGEDESHHLYSPVRAGSPDEHASPTFNSKAAGEAVQQQQQQQQQHQQLLHNAAAAAAAAAQSPRGRPQQQHHHAGLCSLPREVQMRVLCFLSADSLTSLGQTCSVFGTMCNEPVLWRRLFVHRWGKNVRHNSTQSWKVRYMERDAAELAGAGAGQQGRELMQDIFLQAHKAKRHKALGVGAIDDLMLVEDDEVAARVLAWRKSRGFAPQQGPGSSSSSQPQRPDDITLPLPHPSGVGPTGGHTAPSLGFRCSPGSGSACRSRPRVVARPGSGSGGSSSAAGSGGSSGATAAGIDSQQHPALSPLAASMAGLSGRSQQARVRCAEGEAADFSQQGTSTAPAAAGVSEQGVASQPSTAAGWSSSPPKQTQRRRRTTQSRRRWTQIHNVYCDELSGWVHVCDETCSEKIVEPSSGLLVCPISGTCSARLLTCAEEAEEEGDRDEEKEHREEEFGGEKGRLARAFAAGYYCSDEKELLRECGVYLPH